MNIEDQVKRMDAMVKQGAIVDTIKEFMADHVTTSDYGQSSTSDKSAMVQKHEGFAASIEKVNGITHHHSLVNGNVSASEFTFDFDMKDGTKIYWHEIIRRIWDQNGKVTQEEYFNAQ